MVKRTRIFFAVILPAVVLLLLLPACMRRPSASNSQQVPTSQESRPKAAPLPADDSQLPEYRLNEAKGDVCFSQKAYFEAQKYYRRAINDKGISNDLNAIMRLEFMLMLTFDGIGDYSLIASSMKDFESSAKIVGDSTYLASIPFFKGKMAYYQGEAEKGYGLMSHSINLMKKCHGRESEDFLMYLYNSSLKILQRDSLPNRSIVLLGEMEQFFNRPHRKTSSLAFPYETYLKEYYGCQAITLQRTGKEQEAAEYYNKFLALSHVYIYDLKSIESYMLGKGLYDDIIRLGGQRLASYTESDDTLYSNTLSLYRLMAKAYAKKGQYEKAIDCYNLMDKTNEEMARMGELSAIDEISTNYSAYISELDQQRREHKFWLTNIFIVAGFFILIAVLIALRSTYYNRIIRKKNLVMVKTIDELMRVRDQQKASFELFQGIPTQTEASSGNLHRKPMESIADFQERKKFARMSSDIVKKKMYCDPNLSRAMLLEKYNIPRNKFSSMFQKYAGTTYSKFINNLRIEEVTRLLKEQPNYTIEAIAADCGINSVATLYRLFSQRYGMTPVEFRQTIILSGLLKEETAEETE